MVPVADKPDGTRPAGREAAGLAAIVPAATVVPLREGADGLEVLLLRRSSRGAFGGMWVFPGGKIDRADLGEPEQGGVEAPAGAAHGTGTPEELTAACRAAVREAKEEADLDLDEKSLVVHSFWLPPAEAPRRFATWFFLAPAGGEIVVDQGEIHEHRWLTPAAAMAARDRGEIELAPPTFMTLWWLNSKKTVAEAISDAAGREPERFQTRVALDRTGHLAATLWAGDAGYDDGDVEQPGPRRRMWMSPDGWRVEITG